MRQLPLRAEHDPHAIRIFAGDVTLPRITQQAAPNSRPFIHPIRTPNGCGTLTEDAPAHHPWQHGLYTGLNDVNGTGFWTEGKYHKHRAIDGTFHPLPLAAPTVRDAGVDWVVVCEWRAQNGTPLLAETQHWTLRPSLFLELHWTLTALVDLAFGQYDYGGLFLRMPFRQDTAGEVLNSNGQSCPSAEAQRARWCAVSMPIDGCEDRAGLALLDHPSNAQHPTPWRVDNELGIGPSPCIVGGWRLHAGEACPFRYGVLPFNGCANAASIQSCWEEFAAQ